MTMKRDLKSLVAAFSQKTSGNSDQSWKLFYPFWKMPDDSVAVVRFLPDLDEENSLGFLVENLTHNLVINGEMKRVPCLSMYGESCPVCELSAKYYAEKNDVLGKKYYKKRGYIGQVLVIESPIEHDQNQLVKLIEFGPKIFKQIQSAFQSGDLEELPFAYKGGYNFRIKKTKSGQYADYGTSSFAPKQSDIDDDIINQLQLYDLKQFRAKYIDRATLESMLVADQTGTAYNQQQINNDNDNDNDNDNEDNESSIQNVVSTVKPSVINKKSIITENNDPKVEVSQEKNITTSSKAQSVLEQLRARAKAAKAS